MKDSKISKRFNKSVLTISIISALSLTAIAQAQEDEVTKQDMDLLDLEVIVTTGSVKGKSKLKSSLSVTTVSNERAESFAPQGTVDILRSIPGIRAESTGGDSNGNITVRGVPLGGGGSRFLQIHEDGLPVLQFGDIIVGNADNYFTYDQTVSVVEAIKGGTSATLASNSPSGIINFISKTGESEGGSFTYRTGLDHDSNRADFEYGAPVGNNWAFHVGGFYRVGEGVRDTNFTAEDGGQIKISVSRLFENGKIRVYAKQLDDKTPTILPMPVYTDNTAIPGFDPRTASNIPLGLINQTTTDGSGGTRESSIADGNRVKSSVIGGEIEFELTNGITLKEKFRMAKNSGKFFGAFSAATGNATDLTSIGVPNSANLTAGYAHGTDAGVPLTTAELSSLNGNGLIQDIRTFDNDINSLNNFTNDISLTKSFDNTQVSIGHYIANQEADIDWYWQSHIADVQNTPRLLDLYDVDGSRLTANGQLAFGAPQWGNCCSRDTYFDSDISAVYVSVNSDISDDLSVNASIRRDDGELIGSWLQATANAIDINGDGVISYAENQVETFTGTANANTGLFAYDWSYTSFALGFNYILDNNLALFGNYSDGARAGFGDRLADGGYIVQGQAQPGAVVNRLDTMELGVKYQANDYGIFATLFNVNTEDANSESARGLDNPARIREFSSTGVEVEFTANIDAFSFFGGLTWTDAEISDANDASVIGNTPRRQPDLVYSGTGAYTFADGHSLGLSFFGRSDSFVNDNNGSDRILDGYTSFNLFANYFLTDDLSLRFSVNNLTNKIGITEAEGGQSVVNGLGITGARSITGRSSTLALRYEF